jgi:hypothetical protein
MEEPLYLHEEIMLLALRNRDGAMVASPTYHYALAGAILAELLLRHRISIDRRARRNAVVATSRLSVGDPLLDECLAAIAGAKKPTSAQTYVSKFAMLGHLKDRAAERLCGKGVLREEEGKILGIFPTRLYPELDPEPEKRIVRRLSHAIFGDDPRLDARTIVLVSLAHHAGLLSPVFGAKETRSRKTRIEQIAKGEIAGAAVKEAIEAAQSALFVSTIVATFISS